jgi:hypothetical protein
MSSNVLTHARFIDLLLLACGFAANVASAGPGDCTSIKSKAPPDAHLSAATDTGHGPGLTDASWAVGHPEKVIDFGWRAVHLTAVAGKALTAAYYDDEGGCR